MLRHSRFGALVAVVGVLAMTAGPAGASDGGDTPGAVARGTAPVSVSPEMADVFRPEAIARGGRGGDAPDSRGAASAMSDAARRGEKVEVIEERSERSRTYVSSEGVYETVFSTGRLNYRAEDGSLQPVDTTLVLTGEAGSGLRNGGDVFDVRLPAAFGSAPVELKEGGRSIGFSLIGAAPSAPTPSGPTARYTAVLPGVDVVYTVTDDGLKEDLVLADAGAGNVFDFAVSLSSGLRLRSAGDGGVDVLAEDGLLWARLQPPFMHDASWDGASADGYSSGVSLSLLDSAEPTVRVEADREWLAGPDRVWPVTIDPTATLTGAHRDTYIAKNQPTTDFSGSTRLQVQGETDVRRSLYEWEVETHFNEPINVREATLRLYATNDTTGAAVGGIGVHGVTAEWTAGATTWQQRQAGTPWATPGGDFDPGATWINSTVAGPAGWREWEVPSLVQDWVDAERPNHGVALKYENETSGARVEFASANEPGSTLDPQLIVRWEPLVGVRDTYRFEEFTPGLVAR